MRANQFRVGMGHDTHRLEEGRPFMLGGMNIPHTKGPVGHSDGDVLLHAITDALLGSLSLGDIGEWFPNTDSRWAGANSAVFIHEAVAAVRQHGWTIVNLDCTIHAERPKLSQYKRQVGETVARLLEISVDQISVKAKTGEGVGPIGTEAAISADAIVLLEKTS